jgi:glycosyltransferase involved in cell wall biosynthesis
MASGTAVVAAATTALPETCGDAAVLAPPTGEAFHAALTDLLSDQAERERLTAAGIERARRFTWERTARHIDALIT